MKNICIYFGSGPRHRLGCRQAAELLVLMDDYKPPAMDQRLSRDDL